MRRGLFILLLVAACGGSSGSGLVETSVIEATAVDTTTGSPAPAPTSTGLVSDAAPMSAVPADANDATFATTANSSPVGGGPTGAAAHANIAVIGCSQTRDAISGYNTLRSDGRFGSDASTQYLSGASIDVWAEPFNRKWDTFQSLVGPGNDALWIMICWHAQRSVGAGVAMVDDVIARARAAIGSDVPVYISGLNDWDPRDLCPRGDHPASAALADEVAAAGLAIRGPDLGPLQRAHTDDGCHGNRAGNALMGEQMIEFFG